MRSGRSRRRDSATARIEAAACPAPLKGAETSAQQQAPPTRKDVQRHDIATASVDRRGPRASRDLPEGAPRSGGAKRSDSTQCLVRCRTASTRAGTPTASTATPVHARGGDRAAGVAATLARRRREPTRPPRMVRRTLRRCHRTSLHNPCHPATSSPRHRPLRLKSGGKDVAVSASQQLVDLASFAATVHRKVQHRPVMRPKPHRLCGCDFGTRQGVARRRRCPRCTFIARTFADVIVNHMRDGNTYGVPPDTSEVFRGNATGAPVGRPSDDFAAYGITAADDASARRLAAQPKSAWTEFNQRKERHRRHSNAPRRNLTEKCRVAPRQRREYLHRGPAHQRRARPPLPNGH